MTREFQSEWRRHGLHCQFAVLRTPEYFVSLLYLSIFCTFAVFSYVSSTSPPSNNTTLSSAKLALLTGLKMTQVVTIWGQIKMQWKKKLNICYFMSLLLFPQSPSATKPAESIASTSRPPSASLGEVSSTPFYCHFQRLLWWPVNHLIEESMVFDNWHFDVVKSRYSI